MVAPRFVPEGRRFQRGLSGNPGGRPKNPPEMAEVIELARQRRPAAVRRLAQIAMNKKTPPVAAVMACNSILDRGYGKPIQPTLHAFDPRAAAPIVDVDQLTEEQRDLLMDILLLTAPAAAEAPEIDGETLATEAPAISRR